MNEKNQRKKIEYNTKYNKENYVNFSLKIKPELNNKIVNYCKSNNISRPEFLERAIEALNHDIQWLIQYLLLAMHNIQYACILSYKATNKRYILLYIWVVQLYLIAVRMDFRAYNIQWYCSVLCVRAYYILWLMVHACYIL